MEIIQKRTNLNIKKNWIANYLKSHWNVPRLLCRSPLPCFIRRSTLALLVDNDLVVHAELALGHPAQVALHHYSARHVGAQDLAWTGRRKELEFMSLQIAIFLSTLLFWTVGFYLTTERVHNYLYLYYQCNYLYPWSEWATIKSNCS